MTQYECSHLDNDIIYNVSMYENHLSISDLFSSFRNLLIERDKASSNPNSRIFDTNYASHIYRHGLNANSANKNYPNIYEIKAVISSSSHYYNALNSYYTSSNCNFNDFYPIAVRYTDGKNIWLVERPPFLAKIDFKNTRSSWDGNVKEYSIWMPWTSMLIVMNPNTSHYDAHLFINDGPINSLEDYAIPCIFPNIYGDGRMCLNQTSIGLQQHLSSVQKFDISTIYNYIINDYMTGGWNTDLGIQVFDRIINYSPTAKMARSIIVNGDSTQKKIYPTCVTSSGRISTKKYIPNFINYFSRSSLEEITSIVSETKQTIARSNPSSTSFRTYSEIINSVSKAFSDTHLYSQPLSGLNGHNYIYLIYRLICDLDVSNQLDTAALNTDNAFEFKLFEALIDFIKEDVKSDVQNLQQDPTYSSYVPAPKHIFADSSMNVFNLNDTVHDKEFFNNKFPITNQAVQNV